MTTFFLIFIILNLYLLYWSVVKMRKNRKKVELIFWTIPLGAFTWEDLLVFSIFNCLATTVIILVKDFRLALLVFIVFWVVRNFGEMIYWFFQQFSQPTSYPHQQYKDLQIIHNITGKISLQQAFIIMQVFHEVILVTFLAALIILLMSWDKIIVWL